MQRIVYVLHDTYHFTFILLSLSPAAFKISYGVYIIVKVQLSAQGTVMKSSSDNAVYLLALHVLFHYVSRRRKNVLVINRF